MHKDTIYADLKAKILNLELKPGTRLSFCGLKPLYKVSISPIRDALKTLETEGLVVIVPQAGTTVSLIDMSRVRDQKFMRLYLELGAIEKLFKKGYTSALTDRWEALLKRQEAAFSCRNTRLFMDLDNETHRLLFKGCGYEEVFNRLLVASGNYYRIRMVSYLFDDILQSVLDQHRQILDALVRKDEKEVLKLERRHISKIEDEITLYRSGYPQYFCR